MSIYSYQVFPMKQRNWRFICLESIKIKNFLLVWQKDPFLTRSKGIGVGKGTKMIFNFTEETIPSAYSTNMLIGLFLFLKDWIESIIQEFTPSKNHKKPANWL